MEHNMNLKYEYFSKIKNGTKKIEIRLYDEKRRKMHSGDIIIFNNDYNTELLKVRICNIHIFSNFNKLYKKFNKILLGYNENEKAKSTDMKQFYSKENIDKYGVVGIEVEVINE